MSEQWLLCKAKPTGLTSEYDIPRCSLWVSCPSYTLPPPSAAPSQAFSWCLFVSSHIQNSSMGVALDKVTYLPDRPKTTSTACTLLTSYATQMHPHQAPPLLSILCYLHGHLSRCLRAIPITGPHHMPIPTATQIGSVLLGWGLGRLLW